MEWVKYAGYDFIDKIEVIAGRHRQFKLNLSDPCSEKWFYVFGYALRKLEWLPMVEFD